MQRIRFIIPYFGKWPFWMPFFLRTCAHNRDIDWLFFTDCDVPPDAPGNTVFRQTNFSSYCRDVSHKLGIRFAPTSPYKLCDLKPALGHVHVSELDGYDFWGFSDIDLVYGALRNYFTDERLARFDLLSTHERRISGHLCLMRNTEEMRTCFQQVRGWQAMLADTKHIAFDEAAFTRLFIRHKNWPAWLQRASDNFNSLRKRSEFAESFSTPYGRIPWHDGGMVFPNFWRWQHGHLTNDRDGDREFPYFHFIGWKDKAPWQESAATAFLADPGLAAQDRWRVTQMGFARCDK